MAAHRTLVAVVVILIGLLALAVGIIYMTVEAHSLPSVLGRLHSFNGHRTKRGIAALIIGGVLLLVGGWIGFYRPRPSPSA
jgi:uncharacterized membrane protein YidH (DUF202 family)